MSIVTEQRANGCVVVMLDRPDVLNAINDAMLDALDAALDAVPEHARILILTGAGRAFCAGSDISGAERHAEGTEAFARRRIMRMHALILRLVDFPVPSIAALNGLAYGGGLELALACTFRIAAPVASLCLSEIRHSLVPSYGGTQLLPRLIGSARALEMMLTGERMAAGEALRIGLVNAVDPDPVAAAAAYAGRLPNGGGAAQRMIRRAVVRGAGLDLAAALDIERDLAMEIAVSAEARQGAERFMAGRRPATKTQA